MFHQGPDMQPFGKGGDMPLGKGGPMGLGPGGPGMGMPMGGKGGMPMQQKGGMQMGHMQGVMSMQGMMQKGMPPGTVMGGPMQPGGGRALPVLPGQLQPLGDQLPDNLMANSEQGMQAGVQYMPCIVPIESAQSLPAGAVPIGQLSPSQLPNAVMHINRMQAGASMDMSGMGNQGGNFMSQRPERGRSPQGRPARGRSPQGRQGMPGMQPQAAPPQQERDWANVRQRAPIPEAHRQSAQAPRQDRDPQYNHSPPRQSSPVKPGMLFTDGQRPHLLGPINENRPNSKEPWRPTGNEPWRQPERRASAERNERSTERRASPVRTTAAERRGSGSPTRGRIPNLGRPISAERRSSPVRTSSVGPRAKSVDPRHARTMGSMLLECDFNSLPQTSEMWQHSLPNGAPAMCFLVADKDALGRAITHLSQQGTSSLTALGFQGVNLRAAAGRLCLMQVAFFDRSCLQVYLFDIMQLGEHVTALTGFLQSATTPKFIYNAQLAATVLAHKFGLTLMGCIDVGIAYQMIENNVLLELDDYFDWCGVVIPGARQEAQKLQKNPDTWAHRPMAKSTVNFAVQNIATVHASYQMLSTRLFSFCGPQSIDMALLHTNQMVQVHATAGWSCRKAGLWVGEQNPAKEHDDLAMDDWLQKRFGKKSAAPPTRREASPLRQGVKLDLPALPETAVRAEDSPRTASWRVAVAALTAPSQPSRQRSSSPTLDSWLARRSQVLDEEKEPQSKRASSLPSITRKLPTTSLKPDEPAKADNDAKRWDGPFDIGMRGIPFGQLGGDRKAWVDITEDEQTKDAEEDQEELFAELNNMTTTRLQQAEKQLAPGSRRKK